MASDNLLFPLPKTEGPRSIIQQCYDIWIPSRLAWENRFGSRITQASATNRNHPLLRLPPEIRTAIWDFFLAPRFFPESPFSIDGLNEIASRQEYQWYLAARTIELYPPRKGVYPYSTIKLISRNLFEETQAMYNAAVEHYYTSMPLRLKSWDTGYQKISREALQKIDAVRESDLNRIKLLVVDVGDEWLRPEMIFTDGIWRATWPNNFAPKIKRRVIFFERSKASAIPEIVTKHKFPAYEHLEKHHGIGNYKCAVEALVLPNDTDRAVLETVSLAAGSRELTKDVLKAVLYFQTYMWGFFLT